MTRDISTVAIYNSSVPFQCYLSPIHTADADATQLSS